MNDPVLCLNFTDFERTFTSEYAKSDLARAVKLFFQNGGTQCYVTRIANGANPSSVKFKDEAKSKDVMQVTAKSPGICGNTIRVAVTYSGQNPESDFNMEVFNWEPNGGGVYVKKNLEVWKNLSMDPGNGRYVETFINQNSKLVNLGVLNNSPATTGYSQSGRPVLDKNDTLFKTNWTSLIAKTSAPHNIRISADNSPFIDVDLSVDFTLASLTAVVDCRTNLHDEIEKVINPKLPNGVSITVSFESGPAGPVAGDTTSCLRISSANGDVRIQPSASNDAAIPLMLGTDQGGIEVSRYAGNRPAPTGTVFNISSLVTFAALKPTAFTTFTITTDGTGLPALSLQTALSVNKLYQDGYASAVTGNNDGVREKWALIANLINSQKAIDPNFKWSAEVWGSRLALLPSDFGENFTGTVQTTGGAPNVDIGAYFPPNVRFYSLGSTGSGLYQELGVAGADGTAPLLADYQSAFNVIDQKIDLFNLMILPTDEEHTASTITGLWGPASIFCQKRRAFLLMDAPTAWGTVQQATMPVTGVSSLRIGLVKDHSAIFYPRITIIDNGLKVNMGASGAIAGLMARIDSSRGVWKAPAGVEADIRGIVGLEYPFTNDENGVLNQRAINTIRVFPNGIVNWGARTMDGDDDFQSEYKYIPVRRLALFLEESLYRGLKWVVFEPNDEPLWSQIRLNAGAFMNGLFRQGAFQGLTPKDAYFVKCDKETTTQNDINMGVVNIWVGFAPLKPAEFVILHIQQIAGQINQ
ncbi:MAG: phage tail sheath subtilisin-like domain-containing protein [Bacteroidetes bacterium]|nr:phage tail sheath subtilisin-like domain-containing protein [Bacteroidota bacterium]